MRIYMVRIWVRFYVMLAHISVGEVALLGPLKDFLSCHHEARKILYFSIANEINEFILSHEEEQKIASATRNSSTKIEFIISRFYEDT